MEINFTAEARRARRKNMTEIQTGQTNKPVLYVTVGLPRSGKTTWAQKTNLPVVNPDAIRLALHGQRYVEEAEPMVWAIAEVMVRALFRAGHAQVVLDATNNTRKRRARWIGKEWHPVFVLFGIDKETCISRAHAEGDAMILPIIERMDAEHEPVGRDEGREAYPTRDGNVI
jgi:predicted kinase